MDQGFSMKKQDFTVVKEKIIKTNELLHLYNEKNETLTKAKQAFKQLKSKLEGATHEKDRLKVDNERLSYSLELMRPKYEQNEKELGELRADYTKLEDKYQQTMIESQLTISDLEEKVKYCTCEKNLQLVPSKKYAPNFDKVKELKHKCNELKNVENGLKIENDTLKFKNKELKIEKVKNLKVIEEFRIRNGDLQRDLTAIKSKIQKMESASTNQAEIQLSISSLKQNYEKEIHSLKMEISKLSNDNQRIKYLELECKHLKEQINSSRVMKIKKSDCWVQTEDYLANNYSSPDKTITSLERNCKKLGALSKRNIGIHTKINGPVEALTVEEDDYSDLDDSVSDILSEMILPKALSPFNISPRAAENATLPLIGVFKSPHPLDENWSQPEPFVQKCIPNIVITPPTPGVDLGSNVVFPIPSENSETERLPNKTVVIESLKDITADTFSDNLPTSQSGEIETKGDKSVKANLQRRRKFWVPYNLNTFVKQRRRSQINRAKSIKKYREGTSIRAASSDTILNALRTLQENNINFTISNESIPLVQPFNCYSLLTPPKSEPIPDKITKTFIYSLNCWNKQCTVQNTQMLLKKVPNEEEEELLGFFSVKDEIITPSSSRMAVLEKPKPLTAGDLVERLLSGIKELVEGKSKEAAGNRRKRRSKSTNRRSDFYSETETELENLFRTSADVLERNKRFLAAAKEQSFESNEESMFESGSDAMIDSGLVTATSKIDSDSISFCSQSELLSDIFNPATRATTDNVTGKDTAAPANDDDDEDFAGFSLPSHSCCWAANKFADILSNEGTTPKFSACPVMLSPIASSKGSPEALKTCSTPFKPTQDYFKSPFCPIMLSPMASSKGSPASETSKAAKDVNEDSLDCFRIPFSSPMVSFEKTTSESCFKKPGYYSKTRGSSVCQRITFDSVAGNEQRNTLEVGKSDNACNVIAEHKEEHLTGVDTSAHSQDTDPIQCKENLADSVNPDEGSIHIDLSLKSSDLNYTLDDISISELEVTCPRNNALLPIDDEMKKEHFLGSKQACKGAPIAERRYSLRRKSQCEKRDDDASVEAKKTASPSTRAAKRKFEEELISKKQDNSRNTVRHENLAQPLRKKTRSHRNEKSLRTSSDIKILKEDLNRSGEPTQNLVTKKPLLATEKVCTEDVSEDMKNIHLKQTSCTSRKITSKEFISESESECEGSSKETNNQAEERSVSSKAESEMVETELSSKPEPQSSHSTSRAATLEIRELLRNLPEVNLTKTTGISYAASHSVRELFGDVSDSEDEAFEVPPKLASNPKPKKQNLRKRMLSQVKGLVYGFGKNKGCDNFKNSLEDVVSKSNVSEESLPRSLPVMGKEDKKIHIVSNILISKAQTAKLLCNNDKVKQPSSTEPSLDENKKESRPSPIKKCKLEQTISSNNSTPVDILSQVMQGMIKTGPKTVKNQSNGVSLGQSRRPRVDVFAGGSQEKMVRDNVRKPWRMQRKPAELSVEIVENVDEFLDCPRSPDVVEVPDRLPKLIPTEKPEKLQDSKVRALIDKLMIFSNEEKMLDDVILEFAFQDMAFIVEVIIAKLSQDYCDKADYSLPPSPPMTSIQRTLLGFLLKLDRSTHPGIKDKFLSQAELHMYNRNNCTLEIVQPITRLYTAVCKLKYDLNRIRRFMCDGFYFMGDFAVPMLFTILTMWPEMFPMESKSADNLIAKVIVQLCYLKDCNSPGYNFLPLKDLLKKYYGYPDERWNCDDIFKEIMIEYIRNPSIRLSDCTLVLFLKHKPIQWVYEKIKGTIIPLYGLVPNSNPNLKATLVLLLGNICSRFSYYEEYDWSVILEMDKWFVELDRDDLDSLVKRSIRLARCRLPKRSRIKKKNKTARNRKADEKVDYKAEEFALEGAKQGNCEETRSLIEENSEGTKNNVNIISRVGCSSQSNEIENFNQSSSSGEVSDSTSSESDIEC